ILGASGPAALPADVPLVAPLNPEWYDASHPSLAGPPVLGGVDLGMTGSPADIAAIVTEELGSPAGRPTLDWVRQHHSPQAALEEVLRSEEHTSELQSRFDLVCRLLLEKKKKDENTVNYVISTQVYANYCSLSTITC